jgi:hypothetical protein
MAVSESLLRREAVENAVADLRLEGLAPTAEGSARLGGWQRPHIAFTKDTEYADFPLEEIAVFRHQGNPVAERVLINTKPTLASPPGTGFCPSSRPADQ